MMGMCSPDSLWAVQGRLLLLHVLIMAVLAEGGEMGAGQFDHLREALKTAPADLAAMYRRVLQDFRHRVHFGDRSMGRQDCTC